jgi:hypothetical protein
MAGYAWDPWRGSCSAHAAADPDAVMRPEAERDIRVAREADVLLADCQ